MNLDIWRGWFIILYGASGALSLGVIFLYLYTWKTYRRKRERLSMFIKSTGFFLLSAFMILGNFQHIIEPVPFTAWGVALSCAILDAGWGLRIIDLLQSIREIR